MLEINNKSILPQITNLNSDALNILFEFTIFQNKYDFTYHYLFEHLPYRQSVILNLISFLVKVGLIKKIANSSNISKDDNIVIQNNIEDISLPKKRGRKKKVVQEKSQNDLLVNENDQLIVQPFTNNIQKDILLLIGIQQKYLDKIK
jgi:hypothetical protein